jgi:ankyrin repeat protein
MQVLKRIFPKWISKRKEENKFSALHMTTRLELPGLSLQLLHEASQDAGSVINAVDETFSTPLMLAAAYGQQTVVEVLLANGADCHYHTEGYSNALGEAVAARHQGIVRLFLSANADPNIEGYDDSYQMYVASMNGDIEILKLLYKSNADINAESQRRQPYLFGPVDCYENHTLNAAAFEDHEPIVNFLIDHGADVNHESGYCGSLLSTAAAAGNGNMIRLLIKKGAEINKTALSRSSGPKTALEAACWGGHKDVVRLLIAEGADVNSGEKRTHCSALRWTMKIRSKSGARSSIARILLENGAKVDFMGSTICSYIRSGDVEIVNLLLDRCLDVDERSADGRTPM